MHVNNGYTPIYPDFLDTMHVYIGYTSVYPNFLDTMHVCIEYTSIYPNFLDTIHVCIHWVYTNISRLPGHYACIYQVYINISKLPCLRPYWGHLGYLQLDTILNIPLINIFFLRSDFVKIYICISRGYTCSHEITNVSNGVRPANI